VVEVGTSTKIEQNYILDLNVYESQKVLLESYTLTEVGYAETFLLLPT